MLWQGKTGFQKLFHIYQWWQLAGRRSWKAWEWKMLIPPFPLAYNKLRDVFAPGKGIRHWEPLKQGPWCNFAGQGAVWASHRMCCVHGVVPHCCPEGSKCLILGWREIPDGSWNPQEQILLCGPEYNLSHPSRGRRTCFPSGHVAPRFTPNSWVVPTVLDSDPNPSGRCKAGFVLCSPVCLWPSKLGEFLPLFTSISLCTIRSGRLEVPCLSSRLVLALQQPSTSTRVIES